MHRFVFSKKIIDLQSIPACCNVALSQFGGREISFRNAGSRAPGHLYHFMIHWINSFRSVACFDDISASNGIFFFYTAIARGSELVAFEPDALKFGLLSKNRVLNFSQLQKPFIALQLALSNVAGIIDLVSEDLPYEGVHGKFSDSDASGGDGGRQILYSQPTMSDFLGSLIGGNGLLEPDYLKIDVDGAEFSVLCRMAGLLGRRSICEVLVDRLIDLILGSGHLLKDTQSINEMAGGFFEGVSNYLFAYARSTGVTSRSGVGTFAYL